MNKINPDHATGWKPNGLEPTQEQVNFDQIVEDAQLFVATNGRQGIPRQVAVDRLIVHTAKQVADVLQTLVAKEENMGIGIPVIRVSDVRDLLASLTHTEEKPE